MDQRLKGQSVEIRVVQGGNVVQTLQSIENFTSNVDIVLKEDGFLGETVNRFDSVFNGYGGSFSNQPNDASYHEFQDAMVAKARRERPDLVFNIIRTEFFDNGSTAVVTFLDVAWGGTGSEVGSRADYTKSKFEWKCSEKDTQLNNLP